MPACSRSHWEIKLFRNNQITVRVLACDHVWKVYCNDQKCGASRLDCREGGSGGWASQNMLKYIKKRVLCQWEMTTKCRKAPSFLNSVTGVQWMHMLWNMYVGKQCSLAWLMNNIKWRWSVVLCAYKCCGEVSGPHGRWFQSGLKGSYEAVADETDDLLFVVGGSGGWLIWLRMVVMLIVEHWECVWFSKLHWKHEVVEAQSSYNMPYCSNFLTFVNLQHPFLDNVQKNYAWLLSLKGSVNDAWVATIWSFGSKINCQLFWQSISTTLMPPVEELNMSRYTTLHKRTC